MNNITQKLSEWAINKIKTEYKDDIALLIAIENHSVNNDGHGECFDYFIPATERGFQLSQTFIVEGVGHDLYPRSWERTEKTANLIDPCTVCLDNAKILYYRSEDDKNRFLELKKLLSENLNNSEFMYKRVLEKLDNSMKLYQTMIFENELYRVRTAAGYITNYLSDIVFYLNKTYFKDWRNGHIAELKKLKYLPHNFEEYYTAIINAKAIDELKSLSYLLIDVTRKFISIHKPDIKSQEMDVDYQSFADWYQELSLTWRRLRFYCDTNNAEQAFDDACYLQNELILVKDEYGIDIDKVDLLGYFNAEDLACIRKRAEELEKYVIEQIEKNGVKISKYDTIDDFLKKN